MRVQAFCNQFGAQERIVTLNLASHPNVHTVHRLEVAKQGWPSPGKLRGLWISINKNGVRQVYRTPLDGDMVELAGFEPASASLLRTVLHV